MVEIDNEKLYEAALLLKADCEKNYSDGKCRCPFSTHADETGCYGCMHGYPPKNYAIKKSSRWNKEDIALAKALKAFGATHIRCDESGFSRWCIKTEFGGVRFSGYLPGNAFCNLFVDEIAIDDIIKEVGDG